MDFETEKTDKESEGCRGYFLEQIKKKKKKKHVVEQHFTELEAFCITNVPFLVLDSSAIKCYWESFLNIIVSYLVGIRWEKLYLKNHVSDLKEQWKFYIGFSPLLEETCANSC